MAMNQTLRDMLIGKRVLVRTNEDDPLFAGVLVRFEDCRHSFIPVIKKDDGTEVLTMAPLFEYDPNIEKMLSQFTPKEQYKIVKNMMGFCENARDATRP